MGRAKKEARLLKMAARELAANTFVPYTQQERNKKITNIILELSELKLDHVIPPKVTKNLMSYIDTGEEYDENLYLPEYSRTLVIHLDNNKNNDKKNALCLKFNKITIEGEKDNPINKLANLQDAML